MSKFKIFVFSLPASGHVNPLLPVLNELNKFENIEIVVYLSEEFRNKFESIGVRFKPLKNFDIIKKADLKPFGKRRHFELIDLMTFALNGISNNFEFISSEINQEKPDLIIYDLFGSYIKWAFEYYNKSYLTNKKNRPSWPLPPMIGFSATFVYNENIYPNKYEKSKIFPFNFRFFYDIVRIFVTSFKLGIQYGIGFINPLRHLKMTLDNNTKLIIASIFPELHPRSHLYDKNIYKFVGSTIEISSASQLYLDQARQEPFKSIFDKINEINRLENSLKLVYVSLGTLFNNNFEIFKKIIDAFINFDLEEQINNNSIKLNSLIVIVSAGEKCYNKFENLINSNGLKVPDNIKIVKSAPQVEILKRASLFVTHSGMNSTSESIHCGVPMVCIPLSEDQPAVAYRVADELGLGVRLDYTKMEFYDIRKAMHQVLNDISYFNRVVHYSKLSRKYTGYSNAANIIYNFLIDNNKRTN